MVKLTIRRSVKKDLIHPLEAMDILSSDAWMKWAKKQERENRQLP